MDVIVNISWAMVEMMIDFRYWEFDDETLYLCWMDDQSIVASGYMSSYGYTQSTMMGRTKN